MISASQIPDEVVEAAITQEQLKEILHYDFNTGVFSWRVATRNGQVPAGSVAGTTKTNGYVRIEINGRTYAAHRLAWLYMTGSWPPKIIDHIDNVRGNNRFANLRLASPSSNMWNRRKSKSNTSGIKGVTWSKKSQRWQAAIRVNYKSIHLGLFEAKEDALEAVKTARIKYHGAFANDDLLPLPQEASDDA